MVRVREAYPLYERDHRQRVDALVRWCHHELDNCFLVGRNSLFRLDNMHHAISMGVDLDVCATDDVDCSDPLATGTTDDSGEAIVTVPLGATGFDGYVRWAEEEWVPGMGFRVLKFAMMNFCFMAKSSVSSKTSSVSES